MSSYGSVFSKFYNRNSSGYATRIAPRLREYYESKEISHRNKNLLDVCCGTGQIASYFVNNGFCVVGFDISFDMVYQAKWNVCQSVGEEKALFVQGDATTFITDQTFGLAVCTGDSVNHLPSLDALYQCFSCVYKNLIEGGVFIFDFNTHYGFSQRWNNTLVSDTSDIVVINRKFFIEGQKPYASVTGFYQKEDGNYIRFNDNFTQSIFEIGEVETLIREANFKTIYFSDESDIRQKSDNPESLLKAFAVAEK